MRIEIFASVVLLTFAGCGGRVDIDQPRPSPVDPGAGGASGQTSGSNTTSGVTTGGDTSSAVTVGTTTGGIMTSGVTTGSSITTGGIPTGGSGGASTGSTTTGGTIPPDPGSACWSNQLLDPQPWQPTLLFPQACEVVSRGAWLDADAGVGAPRNSDGKANLIGRWAACQSGNIVGEPHAGIEFGVNGRWLLLARDASGAFSPTASPRGFYYLLSIGQLNVGYDAGSGGAGQTIGRVQFSADRQALRITNSASIYVRIPMPADHGRDNVPSLSDGKCSLVGTWDTAGAVQGNPLSISFDALGNFVAGAPGADLCVVHPMYGTYRLMPGTFEITQNWGMGFCDFWFAGGFKATFDAGCNRVHLVTTWDNCTGGRGYLNGTNDLVKRR